MDSNKKQAEHANGPTTPLLHDQSHTRRPCCRCVVPETFRQEFRETFKISLPLVFTQLCLLWMQPIATMFAGHLGKLELDAVGLANALISSFGNAIVNGLVTGGDTVFAQTFGGDNKKLMGLQLQRCLIIVLLALMLCLAFHINMEHILLLLGQDPRVASMVGRYLLIFIPGLMSLFLGVLFRRYMQAQNIVLPHIIIGAIGLVAHVVAQYLFVYQFEFGIEGSAIAQSLAYLLIFILTIGYMIVSGVYRDTWSGWDIRCLAELGPLLQLSLFGMAMLCLEWWAFEITLIVAGILGTTELAVQAITMNLDLMFYCIPDGTSIATSIRIGQHLGAGQPAKAKIAARVGIVFLACTSLIVAGIMASCRYQLPYIFTNVPEVVNITAMLLPFVAFYTFFDNMSSIGRGVMRGTGQQPLGTAIIFTGFYVFAMPLGFPLMFATPLGLVGLWIGLSFGVTTCGIVYLIYINWFAKWEELSVKARHRAGIIESSVDKSSLEESYPLLNKSCEEEPDLQEDNLAQRESPEITGIFIIKRLAAMMVPVLLLIVGILCRIFVPLPYVQNHANNTDLYNSTEVSSFIYTTSDINTMFYEYVK